MTALVVGVGLTGRSLASHLLELGEEVLAIDSRQSPPMAEKMPPVEIWRGEDFRLWPASRFKQFTRVALSAGVSPADVAAPLETITGDAELFTEAWRMHKPLTTLLAVTGTNGKSSTTAMTVHLCKMAGDTAEAVGNIGEPLLDAFWRWKKSEFPAVVAAELSSFQLQTAAGFNSDAAVVLNVSDDHLDRHGDLSSYAKTKARIYKGARTAAANGDDPLVLSMSLPEKKRVFAINNPAADWTMRDNIVIGGDLRLAIADMSMAAAQQPENVLAALSLMDVAGLKPVGKGLENFIGLPHRRQVIKSGWGLTFIDDSKATNVSAACAALYEMSAKTVLIAGGDGKGQDFKPLAQTRARACAISLSYR